MTFLISDRKKKNFFGYKRLSQELNLYWLNLETVNGILLPILEDINILGKSFILKNLRNISITKHTVYKKNSLFNQCKINPLWMTCLKLWFLLYTQESMKRTCFPRFEVTMKSSRFSVDTNLKTQLTNSLQDKYDAKIILGNIRWTEYFLNEHWTIFVILELKSSSVHTTLSGRGSSRVQKVCCE